MALVLAADNRRATQRLLRDCALLGAESRRPSADRRLEAAVGKDLASLLMFALGRGQRRRRRGTHAP
jgi:hypothetical protein